MGEETRAVPKATLLWSLQMPSSRMRLLEKFLFRRQTNFSRQNGGRRRGRERGAGPLVPIRKEGTRKREQEEPNLSPQEHHGQPSGAQDQGNF